MQVYTEYLSSVYHKDNFKANINRAVRSLAEFEKTTPFDAIAFTGTSGAALAYPISYLMDKGLLCIRKQESQHFYNGKVEGFWGSQSYIIVDDFVSSGNTIRAIIDGVTSKSKSELVGIYLYDSNRWGESWDAGVPYIRKVD